MYEEGARGGKSWGENVENEWILIIMSMDQRKRPWWLYWCFSINSVLFLLQVHNITVLQLNFEYGSKILLQNYIKDQFQRVDSCTNHEKFPVWLHSDIQYATKLSETLKSNLSAGNFCFAQVQHIIWQKIHQFVFKPPQYILYSPSLTASSDF